MDALTIIPGRVVFESFERAPSCLNTSTAVYFTTDNELVYEHFFADFGPLNLGRLYRFCERLHKMLTDPGNAGKVIHYYSSTHLHKRANAAFLVGGFTVVCLGWSAEKAFAPFLGVYPPFIPFRDAAFGLCTYTITLLDCFRALEKAVLHSFFDYSTFNIDEYEHMENIENGDLNWIVPKKFIAFSGPLDSPKTLKSGKSTFTPHDYVPVFKKKGVSAVIRLNKPMYNRNAFLSAGIKHADMFYPDGGNPPEQILRHFIELCEKEGGAVGVHCKAGLGRTGTCIGAYVMKHYKFSAREVIAWFRICRPGSIVGPQQHYLEENEARFWKMGTEVRRRFTMPAGRPPPALVLEPTVETTRKSPSRVHLDDHISSPTNGGARAGAGIGVGAGAGGGDVGV